MVRITKQTDYAIMLLGHLARHPAAGWMTARDAAEWSGLSLPMVSKIFKSLVRGGIVVSQRGTAGGYNLRRPLLGVSLAELIRALEGPIGLVECCTQPGHCDQEPICPVRVNWSHVNREIEQTLERIPVSRMVTPNLDATDLLHVGASGSTPVGTEPRT